MSELYNQEEDHREFNEPHTWEKEHEIGRKMTRTTEHGVNIFSNDLGHGPDCASCSAGVLESHAQDLSRDEHFRAAMYTHNNNLGKNI